MILHILKYFILGPILGLLLRFTRLHIFGVNMGFSSCKGDFIIQTITWGFNTFMLYTFCFDRERVANIYFVEILYMEIYLFFRAYSISCKYASLHKNKM